MAQGPKEFKVRDGATFLVKSDEIVVGTLTADNFNTSSQNFDDDNELCFGDDTDFCISYDSSLDALVIENAITSEQLGKIEKDGTFVFDAVRSRNTQTVSKKLPSNETRPLEQDESMVVSKSYEWQSGSVMEFKPGSSLTIV